MTSLVKVANPILTELQDTNQMCQMLMQTPYYANLGSAGIVAILETAKSLGIDPRQALCGGLYFVKGKVEMSARMMNSLIRSKKHSISRDPKSDDTICILHGKRADNGDTWTVSFSLEDAKRAGLANNTAWKSFTQDMLFARALSRLARQLFPDVIGNVYIEGEISLDANIPDQEIAPAEQEEYEAVTEDDVRFLERYLPLFPEFKARVDKQLKSSLKIYDYRYMPKSVFNEIKIRLDKKIERANSEGEE